MNKNIVVFIIATFLCLNAQSFPIPKDGEAKFDIIRKNKIIGTHEILFSKNNRDLIIETNIDIKVKILFVTAYTFSHQSKEIWRNGNFIKIDGFSDFEDEREYFIKGEIKDGFLFASGMDGELKLDKNMIPSNFWNIETMYQDEIFDTQKGIVRKLSVKESGKEIIKINNKKIDCIKFILNASSHPKDKNIFPEYTLWYSKEEELMKYRFIGTKNNKMVEVIRTK